MRVWNSEQDKQYHHIPAYHQDHKICSRFSGLTRQDYFKLYEFNMKFILNKDKFILFKRKDKG